MIPIRYREKLPIYWYENKEAETHFEAMGGEIDYLCEEIHEWSAQFLLPYATWGLDTWDWIYFGDIRTGTYEERRAAIRMKNLSKARFTLRVLRELGKEAGNLSSIDEDFLKKEVLFRFYNTKQVFINQLREDFEQLRPVHVNRAVFSVFDQIPLNLRRSLPLRILSRAKFPGPFVFPLDGTVPLDGTWSLSGREIYHRNRQYFVIKRQVRQVVTTDWGENELYPIKRLPIDSSWAIQGIVGAPLTIEETSTGGHSKSRIQIRRKDGICTKRMVIV
ncbi:hypothetical protein HPY28_18530 [Brevibacillus sp. HB1.2]|uniref:hypothetical protein n=1 Tax=Brevibacillus sp. HB1.2 TaxID=2738807 RepID=UPI00157634D3|nr:hypothetical protein [Brevibacillus sp. HB1.2]NTU22323.1 hypothetical protein [Brevibacillus sp. HB1.2]